MSSESPRSKSGTPSASAPPEGVELLDDLLKELEEPPTSPKTSPGAIEPGEPSGEGSAEAEGGPPTTHEPPSEPATEEEPIDHRAELAEAEMVSLKSALERQQSVEQELREELAGLRSELEGMKARLEAANARFLPAAPVAFLDAEGRSVARKAFFALGKGEGLDHYLTDLLKSWRGSGRPLVPRWDPDGFSLTVEGDPEKRSVRVLSSGVYLIKLGKDELAALGELPPLVRHVR